MAKTINIIFASQEFDKANHKELWSEISKKSVGITIVINIGADFVVSVVKRKIFRITEALSGPKKLNDKLFLIRPLYIARPEISSRILNKANVRLLKSYLKRIVNDIDQCHVNILHYGNVWPILIDELGLNVNSYYYIMDELRNDAHDNKLNIKRAHYDNIACEKSEKIFAMSPKILENRMEFSEKIKVIGNGASIKKYNEEIVQIKNSVGLIGNIRNWIDFELLEDLILNRKDLHFGLVGNIEENMKDKIYGLVSNHSNVKYYGEVNKEEVHNWYKKFNVIIVPYIQNDFMKATRPIKIVESIFALTPVVTIPVSGYKESEYIKFARSSEEFSKKIDFMIMNKIDSQSQKYKEFIELNSWSKKAEEIVDEFK